MTVESTPTLEWKQKKGVWEAELPDGVLSIVPVRLGEQSGSHDLWFHGAGARGTNQLLSSSHPTVESAKDYAKVWVGDNG